MKKHVIILLALFVFGGLFIFLRIIEIYIVPYIPSFFTREIGAIFKWGPVLIPIIYGITYFSNDKKLETDDILKKRMMLWTK